jgi:hypothetical protein
MSNWFSSWSDRARKNEALVRGCEEEARGVMKSTREKNHIFPLSRWITSSPDILSCKRECVMKNRFASLTQLPENKKSFHQNEQRIFFVDFKSVDADHRT